MRDSVDVEHMEFLAADIARRGQLEPVLVRQLPDGRYELINGVHRFGAMQKLGKETIACTVMHVSEQESVLLQVLTNYRNRRLKAHELVRSVATMSDKLGMTLEAIGKELGYSKSYISMLYQVYLDRVTFEDLRRGRIRLSEACKRANSKGSSITELSQDLKPPFLVKCTVCAARGDSDEYMRVSACPTHAFYLKKATDLLRLSHRQSSSNGLKALDAKLDQLVDELTGRISLSLPRGNSRGSKSNTGRKRAPPKKKEEDEKEVSQAGQ